MPLGRIALSIAVPVDEGVRPDARQSQSDPGPMQRIGMTDPALDERSVVFAAIFQLKNARFFLHGESVRFARRRWSGGLQPAGRRAAGEEDYAD